MSSLSLPHMKLSCSLSRRSKFWRRKTKTTAGNAEEKSDPDLQFRVAYLGNILTGKAKGDGCLDTPLPALWRNHISSDKPHIVMKVTITASGLKAVTKEHGLTEYWAHRITYCAADPSYPKVFCWIYRHEGRKMKQELRCHAVLCPSENKARSMAERLQARLKQSITDLHRKGRNVNANKGEVKSRESSVKSLPDQGKVVSKLKIFEQVILEEEEEDEESEVQVGLNRSTSAPNLGKSSAQNGKSREENDYSEHVMSDRLRHAKEVPNCIEKDSIINLHQYEKTLKEEKHFETLGKSDTGTTNCDMTVHSAMIECKEGYADDKPKRIGRSEVQGRDFLCSRIREFCINI